MVSAFELDVESFLPVVVVDIVVNVVVEVVVDVVVDFMIDDIVVVVLDFVVDVVVYVVEVLVDVVVDVVVLPVITLSFSPCSVHEVTIPSGIIVALGIGVELVVVADVSVVVDKTGSTVEW